MKVHEIIYLFLFSLIFFYSTNYLSKKFNFFDIPNNKKIHKQKTPNIAGLSLIPYILIIFFFFNFDPKISFVLNLVILIVIIGFLDDINNFSPASKLALISLPVFYFAKDVSNIKTLGDFISITININSLSLIFTILCVLLLTNAFNYIDGLDGILSIIVISTLLYFLIFSQSQLLQVLVSFLIYFLVYLLFNFNFFNFFPKQFLGDSGSLGIGFFISAISVVITQGEKIIDPELIIWPLALTVYEFLTVNIIRIKQNKNPFERDLNFIFNNLEKKIGKIYTILSIMIIQVFFCLNGLLLKYLNLKNYSIILFISYFWLYLLFRVAQKR